MCNGVCIISQYPEHLVNKVNPGFRKKRETQACWRAYSALEEIAKENGLTISQAVLYLKEVYERALNRRVAMPKAGDLEEFRRSAE